MTRWYVARSAIAGRGVFANTEIPADTFIETAKGTAMRRKYKAKRDYMRDNQMYPIAAGVWMKPDQPVRFLNHSCDPNAGFKTPRRIYARRAIKNGEEITVDYSTIEYVDFWTMRCTCKSAFCRQEIRSIQFLTAHTFRRYLPYVPKFMQKFYRRARQK